MEGIRDRIAEIDPELIMLPEQYDECVIGIGERSGSDTFVVYDKERLLEIMATEYGDSDDPELDAIEWYEYNTLRSGGYIEGSPVYLEVM